MSQIHIQCSNCFAMLSVPLAGDIPSPCPRCGTGYFRLGRVTISEAGRKPKPCCATCMLGLATERLQRDAEFAAKVEVAVQLSAQELLRRTGGGVLQRHERTSVRVGAAVGLLMADYNTEELTMALPDKCTQCGSAYEVCAFPDCGEKIIFVPVSGFGQRGEWRHIEPPDFTKTRHHQPHPVLKIT